jgi:site-specific DNA recombinase
MVNKRAVIYTRVSTAGQEENFSLGSQEAACRTFAESNGWTVVAVEQDVASGANRNRVGLDRALSMIERGEADTLLAHALDRISRHQIDVAVIVDRVEVARGTLALVTEDFEHSPVGTFIRSARAFAAEIELAKIGERTARGRHARLASGKPLAGRRAIYGYVWADAEKSRLAINPDTAPIVREIFDRYLNGGALRAIAMDLTARAVPTPSGQGHRWGASVVQRILSNPAYAGRYTALQRRWERPTRGQPYRSRRARDDEQIVIPGIAPAIVTEAEFATVQARFAFNKKHAVRNNPHPEHYLLRAGYVRCGYCGYALGASSPEKGRAIHANKERYVCGNLHCRAVTIAVSTLDANVWDLVCRVLRDPNIIAAEVARQEQDDTRGVEADCVAVERLLADVIAKQTNAASAIVALSDEDAAAPVRDMLRALAERRKELEAEKEALDKRRASKAGDRKRLVAFGAWAERVAANLDTLTYDERRMALEALGVAVEVYQVNDETHPRWRATMRPAPVGESAIVSRYL